MELLRCSSGYYLYSKHTHSHSLCGIAAHLPLESQEDKSLLCLSIHWNQHEEPKLAWWQYQLPVLIEPWLCPLVEASFSWELSPLDQQTQSYGFGVKTLCQFIIRNERNYFIFILNSQVYNMI